MSQNFTISDIQLQKFQALYKEKFGIELSKPDAYEQGMNLIHFFLRTHTSVPGERQNLIASPIVLDTVREASLEIVLPS